MAKSNAERQREYRTRRNADSQRREEYLRKERDRWRRDTDAGKNMSINDLSERARRCKRKMWRKAKERQKRKAEINNTARPNPANMFEIECMVEVEDVEVKEEEGEEEGEEVTEKGVMVKKEEEGGEDYGVIVKVEELEVEMEDSETEESEPEKEEATAQTVQTLRMQQDVSQWCTCGNCARMPTEAENICCMEIPQSCDRLLHHQEYSEGSPKHMERSMPLSNKERQRLFRARRNKDPQARAEFLERKRASYYKDKSESKIKTPVRLMTPFAARKRRDQWRVNKRNQRERMRWTNEIMNDTPVSMNGSNLKDPQFEPQPSEPDEPQPHPPHPSEPNEPQENAQPLASSTPERNNSNTSKRFVKLKKETRQLKDEIIEKENVSKGPTKQELSVRSTRHGEPRTFLH